MSAGRFPPSAHTTPFYSNGLPSPLQQNGIHTTNAQPNGISSNQLSNGGYSRPNGAIQHPQSEEVNCDVKVVVPARPRLLGVDEALKYSPFSSIVPFSSDIIPVPNAHVHAPQPLFTSSSEQHRARQQLEYLNHDLVRNDGNMSVAQRVKGDLKPLLDQSTVTDFRFRNLPDLGRSKGSDKASSRAPVSPVGAFANSMLHATNLANRYPTPTSPEEALPATKSKSHVSPPKVAQPLHSVAIPKVHPQPVQKQPPAVPKTQHQAQNDIAFSKNARFSGKGTNQPMSTQIQPTPMVVVPLPSAEIHHSDFLPYTEPPAKDGIEVSRKRKRESEFTNRADLLQTRDQRAAADEVLAQFEDLTQNIFEAEDQLQPNTLNNADSLRSQYFAIATRPDGEVLTLFPSTQVHLNSLLNKLNNVGRFRDIPVEHLQRLQRLCEGSLTSAESLDLKVDVSCSVSEDFSSWMQMLEAVDAGLRSAQTILKIMTCGREDKQLFSEELLQGLLGLIKNVLDNVIIPMTEIRSSGPTSAIFEGASEHKKVISQLAFDTTKVMVLVAKLLVKAEMAEIMVNTIEFLATQLLFVENAQSEKDSVIGIQRFETLRREAMNITCVVFARYSEQQRASLLGEILGSIQKLPVNERQARQYRLVEGKSIMLVSALIMQLVQISATEAAVTKRRSFLQRKPRTGQDRDSSDGSDEESPEVTPELNASTDSDASSESDHHRKPTIFQKLHKRADFLIDNATKNAQHIVGILVQRASKTARSSESPHRAHLDMIVSDLINALGMPEWPAAELVLRVVYASCRQIAELPQHSAAAKSMALELLGMLGSALSELKSRTNHSAKSLENQESALSVYLRQLCSDYEDGSLESSEMLLSDGPYHVIVELLGQGDQEEAQSNSARSYLVAQWAKAASTAQLKVDSKTERLIKKLDSILFSDGGVSSDSISTLTINQSRVAYGLILLTMDKGFCCQSDYILKILLDSINSEQIQVRNKSLKSVEKMLEGDPAVLDRAGHLKVLITNAANDKSPQVRDSALTIIGKCINLRPDLESEFLRLVLRLTDDSATPIRKRSIKMLKDIYLRNSDQSVKIAIATSLLQRAKDLESSVSELSHHTCEDIWILPFHSIPPQLAQASAQNKVDLRKQTKLMINTIRRGGKVSTSFNDLLQAVLSKNSKNAAGNLQVCKLFVATAFDMMDDDIQDAERLERRDILQTLTVFALANPNLFTADHLRHLQPYIANLSGKDDHENFQCIVVIFRCVLSVQSSVQHGLLREIRLGLQKSIPKLGKAEFNEVAACLWAINGILNDPEPLLKLMTSCLEKLHNMKEKNFSDTIDKDQLNNLKMVKKYLQIAGSFGKHCDFEKNLPVFQKALPWCHARSVAEVIVQSIQPFTIARQPLSLQIEAYDSIGLVCQTWPYQFTRERISNAFRDVLRQGEPEVQTIVLSNFRDFFAKMDRQAEERVGGNSDGKDTEFGEKLGGSMTASDRDGASALIAQQYLQDMLRIALASQDASALTATEVIASINRQGLVHPKESGPALVALETSTNLAIASTAFQEHRLLHQQHESTFEREYMRAIQEAFKYQKEIVGDPLGFTVHPFASKLSNTFDIIKTSKSKYQKKFISNFCSKIDFEMAKMDMTGSPPNVLQFSRFLTENLAFFDYGRMDELLHTMSCMEKVVGNTGSGVAHSISTEVFNVTIESVDTNASSEAPQVQEPPSNTEPSVDPARLRQLATASIILHSLWETQVHLRRLYGLSTNQQKREGKNKTAAKDLNKAPSRALGITGDKLIASIAERVASLDSEEAMKAQCKDFVELLSVDNEVKVNAESDGNSERMETPSIDEEEQDTPMSGRPQGLKRKGSASANGTPTKKKRGRPSLKRRKSGKSIASDEDWD